jgi:hypothetical protein
MEWIAESRNLLRSVHWLPCAGLHQQNLPSYKLPSSPEEVPPPALSSDLTSSPCHSGVIVTTREAKMGTWKTQEMKLHHIISKGAGANYVSPAGGCWCFLYPNFKSYLYKCVFASSCLKLCSDAGLAICLPETVRSDFLVKFRACGVKFARSTRTDRQTMNGIYTGYGYLTVGLPSAFNFKYKDGN